MRTSRMVAARSILASMIVALVILVPLVLFAPNTMFLSPNNYGWNGIQQVSSQYTITPVSSLAGLQPVHSVLLLVQPTVNYTQEDANAVEQFARDGGVVVIADSSGGANELLRTIGTGVQVESRYTLDDPTYNWGSDELPTALVLPNRTQQFGFLAGVKGIALDAPSPLNVEAGEQVYTLAVSSPVSTELDRSGGPLTVGTGSFPVVVAEKIGDGSIIVIGDSQLFTNSVWALADNRILAANLMTNSTVYLDTSHWQPNTDQGVRAALDIVSSWFSSYPLRYVTVIVFVAAAIFIVTGFSELNGKEEGEPKKSLITHITFNKEAIERVEKERRKHGVKPD